MECFEDGSGVDVLYDGAGRPTRYSFDGGEVNVAYDAVSGRATRFDGPQGNAIRLVYDPVLFKQLVSRPD